MARWISSFNSRVSGCLGGRLSRVIGVATLAACLMLGMTVTTVFAQSVQEMKGCYVMSGKKKVQFRMLTGTSTTCKSTETPVSSAEVGPAGPQGDQDIQGEKGDQGGEGRQG
jgi:hypothetical protein